MGFPERGVDEAEADTAGPEREVEPFIYKPYPSADELGVVRPEWAHRYKEDAAKHWDSFYARNTLKAYKDRHYLGSEFAELADSSRRRTVIELGCGVGNTVFPMLEANSNLFAFACDFSPKGVEMVKTNPRYDPARIRAAVCDITCGSLPAEFGEVRADIATLIFVLGSIAPLKMGAAIRTAASGLRDGGRLFFRDHAVEDLAQQRFETSSEPKRIEENLYVRRDNTLSYYFSLEVVQELFAPLFDVERLEFTIRRLENRKEGLQMERKFVTGVFRLRASGAPTAELPSLDEQ
ncbi:S-adenosyl-L-methionine-dependent methyltransferase [Pavlovales sp. CCMP2436]|nr:S-adenosyl-L-methionine-dependent methyltransferase [Pavlovales sp. CCMP2436]